MDSSQYYNSQRPDSPTQTRTLFPKGPIFNLDDFSSKDFIAKDFVESLTETAQSSTRRSHGPPTNGPFDPKPLIRAFEQASHRLDELSSELEQRENESSTAVRKAEALHASNTETLGQKLNITNEKFQKIDASLKSDRGERWGGNIAVETGRRIEELDRQRRKALDAHIF